MARLIDYFPSWYSGNGLFAKMTWSPWHGETDIDEDALDYDYFGNHSGYREASPLLDKLSAYGEYQLSDEATTRLLNIIRGKFLADWSRLWTALQSQYNPIQNYDMTEEEDGSHNQDLTRGTTDTNTQVKGVTVTSNAKADVTNADSLRGFGESSMTSISESNTSQNKLNNETSTVSSGQDTDTLTHTGKDTDSGWTHRKLTRSGNIGVTTSQQMLESEYELRKKHFFDAVFDDVDRVLTSPIWRI